MNVPVSKTGFRFMRNVGSNPTPTARGFGCFFDEMTRQLVLLDMSGFINVNPLMCSNSTRLLGDRTNHFNGREGLKDGRSN